MKRRFALTLIAAATAGAEPAYADEVFGGVLVHDVKTGLTKSGFEPGVDFQLGWRGDRIQALRVIGAPAPHVFGSLNSAGATHYGAAGISWKIGRRFYARPGVGLAVHDGPGEVVPGDGRIDFGSRILFQLEFGAGYQLSERTSVEATIVHLSHAQLFSPQNPGLDNIGLRLNHRF
jgi:hypothetical protein